MNRAPLHGAPVRGQVPPSRGPPRAAPPSYGAQPAYGNQDARGNLAVQPAATTGSFKLKKAAVKMVGAAGTTPDLVKSKPKEVKRQEPAKLATRAASPPVTQASSPIETAIQSTGEESAIDDLFARLIAQGARKSSKEVRPTSPSRPQSGVSSFGDDLSALDDATAGSRASVSSIMTPPQSSKNDQPTVTPEKEEVKNMVINQDMSHADMEQLYLRKSADHLEALPSGNNMAVQMIKAISIKLRNSYAVNSGVSGDEMEKLKARYAFAIQSYIKQVFKDTKPITSDYVKKVLQDTNGDLLRVCVILAEEKLISLENMDNVTGLCKMIHNSLPKPETTVVKLNTEFPTPSLAVHKPLELVPGSKDPLESLKPWPTQENRAAPPAYRSCILKGVSSVKNINQLQALVWGGRLESISMPAVGTSFALVRFLEPDACDKYFKATENGIEIQGEKKALVFVEKQPGPTSINDTIRNCTDGNVSRCVRALDVDDDDWNDVLLMKIARGKGALKRDVDTIKRGKTARGRPYIEFRFASIYHALSFKRELNDDEEWDACTINYATDPCEIANGVHYKDVDESGAGFFA